MAETLLATDPTTALPQPVLGTRLTQAAQAAQARRTAQTDRLCTLARSRFALAAEAEAPWRQKAVEALHFRAGEQWHPDQVKARQDPRNPRPCLTINQVPRFIRQITNAEQQNRPTIKVRPVDSLADPQTAKVYDGLIRAIEAASDGDIATDTAFDSAVTHGRGYWRILIDYETAWSFQKVLKIDRILNPFAVYLDPQGRQHPDYHSANWGFVIARLNRAVACEQYEVPHATYEQWSSYGDTWVGKDECLVADYYYREEMPVQLIQLRDGDVRYVPLLRPDEDATDEEREAEATLLQHVAWQMTRRGIYPMTEDAMRQVQQERRSRLPVLYQCKLLGYTPVEGPTVWPGQFIPIVPVLGDEIDIEGQTEWRGLVWDMMDAARAYNYWTSLGAETVALAPKAPWIGTVQQFRGREHEWAGANQVPYAYLAYNMHSDGGMVAPPPQRNVQEPAIMAIANARQQAAQDLYNTSGIQPADLGEASGTESSGKHAQIRKTESELGTSHYRMSLVRALRHRGRILIDLIPAVYHEPGRILRILGVDQQASQVQVDPLREQPVAGPDAPDGLDGIVNLNVGTYDVVVDTGPGYLTQRQEAAANLIDLASAIPKAAEVIPDLIISMQDWDGAEEAARRMKKTLPPQLLDEQSQKPEDQVAQLTAQLQQTKQEAQALNAHAQQVEQAAQQMAQEHQQLKGDQSVQQAEVHLKQAEMGLKQMEMQLKQRELALKELELQVKREEVQLRAQVDMVQAQAEIEKARLSVEAEKADAQEDAG